MIENFVCNGDAEVLSKIKDICNSDVTIVITGGQSTGKTTLLSEIIKYKGLSEYKNVTDVCECGTLCTEHIKREFDRSDSTPIVCGRLHTDGVISIFTESLVVNSKYGMAVHHANNTLDLINSLVYARVNKGLHSDFSSAVSVISECIDIDIHLDKDENGNRYIDRITRIEKLDNKYKLNDIVRYNKEAKEYVIAV